MEFLLEKPKVDLWPQTAPYTQYFKCHFEKRLKSHKNQCIVLGFVLYIFYWLFRYEFENRYFFSRLPHSPKKLIVLFHNRPKCMRKTFISMPFSRFDAIHVCSIFFLLFLKSFICKCKYIENWTKDTYYWGQCMHMCNVHCKIIRYFCPKFILRIKIKFSKLKFFLYFVFFPLFGFFCKRAKK